MQHWCWLLTSDRVNFYFEIDNLPSDKSFSFFVTKISIYFSIPDRTFFFVSVLIRSVFCGAKSLIFLKKVFWQFVYAKFYSLIDYKLAIIKPCAYRPAYCLLTNWLIFHAKYIFMIAHDDSTMFEYRMRCAVVWNNCYSNRLTDMINLVPRTKKSGLRLTYIHRKKNGNFSFISFFTHSSFSTMFQTCTVYWYVICGSVDQGFPNCVPRGFKHIMLIFYTVDSSYLWVFKK